MIGKVFLFINLCLFSMCIYAEEKIQINNVNASSTLVEKEKGAGFYGSKNLIDNSYKSWVEGVEGDGIGESISFEFESPIDIKGIGIRNGYGDLRLYFANNRVKHLEVYINDAFKTCFRLADTCDSYVYSFLRYDNVKKISFTIKDVYKGTKYHDTCLNEIYFYTDFDYDEPEYKEDDYTKKVKNAFPKYSDQFDKLLYSADGNPYILHPIDPPNENDIWCFNDMEFYSYKNGVWNLNNSNPMFSFLRKDIEYAKNNKYEIVFSFGQASGYSENMYGYVLKVTAPSYTVYEYDFDGYAFKTHDEERKYER